MQQLAQIKPFTYEDQVTGDTIEIAVSPQYSSLRVNNRYYYFELETGELDGTSTEYDPPIDG